MKIMGIDPGVATIGYGVIDKQGKDLKFVDYGCIITKSEEIFHKRLGIIYKEVRALVKKHQPDAVACEEIFFFNNAKTAINVGHARGVILLALSGLKMDIFEYTPLHVKQIITGYGRADKKEMQEKTKQILGLAEIPKPDDAADALAIALCHLWNQGGMRRTRRQKSRAKKK
jgi:crossover junction endodeoxyribonuclease RuvC